MENQSSKINIIKKVISLFKSFVELLTSRPEFVKNPKNSNKNILINSKEEKVSPALSDAQANIEIEARGNPYGNYLMLKT